MQLHTEGETLCPHQSIHLWVVDVFWDERFSRVRIQHFCLGNISKNLHGRFWACKLQAGLFVKSLR